MAFMLLRATVSLYMVSLIDPMRLTFDAKNTTLACVQSHFHA